MRPNEHLKPGSPVHEAGMRMLPPPSEPVQNGTWPAATAADEPPLEPPGVRSGFQGLRETPQSRFFVIAVYPNSGEFVLPMAIAPAAFSRCTCVESPAG